MTDQKIKEIMDWIYDNYGAHQVKLSIGIWSEEEIPYTFFAVIEEEESREVVLGESSYGADSIEEALDNLLDEIKALNEANVPTFLIEL